MIVNTVGFAMMCLTNIKPCNFLRNSVMWEPLFYFLDEETEKENRRRLPKAIQVGKLPTDI